MHIDAIPEAIFQKRKILIARAQADHFRGLIDYATLENMRREIDHDYRTHYKDTPVHTPEALKSLGAANIERIEACARVAHAHGLGTMCYAALIIPEKGGPQVKGILEVNFHPDTEIFTPMKKILQAPLSEEQTDRIMLEALFKDD